MPARGSSWARYAAPAAFLLAVTIAALLVRSAIRSDSGPTTTTVPGVTVVRKQYYRVRAGDTLTSIARRFHLSVTRLERLNPRVRSTSLFIGQRIRVG